MTNKPGDIIEIPSSDEDGPSTPVTKTGSPSKSLAKLSLITRIQGKRGPFVRAATNRVVHDKVVYVSSDSESESEKATPSVQDTTEPLLYSPVKASHKDVIDLTFSSEDETNATQARPRPALKRLVKGSRPEVTLLSEAAPSSLSSRGVSSGSDGGAGSKERRPKPEDTESESSSSSESEDDTPVVLPAPRPKPTPRAKSTTSQTPRSRSVLDTPACSAGEPVKKGKASRVTKKALREAEQARREKYAQELFEELNASVFDGGLPKETKLNWSNRLLTTAGRAKWRRSRDGTQTTEIELATKVLDSDDRIRNTLSHEMCHLACWVINGDPKEGHGRAFKAWANKVTRKRPDITVSTRHNYEINYPYEWECDNCAKIYGRYSKSIRPDECRCGTCKVGKLVPLFKTRVTTTSKAKATGKTPTTASDGRDTVASLLESFVDLTVTTKTSSGSTGTSSLKAIDELKALTEELGGLSSIDWTPTS